jgi:hypothetical protein
VLISPRRAWLSAAFVCFALLILPGIAWLLAPRLGGFTLPPAPATARAAPIEPFEPSVHPTPNEPPRPEVQQRSADTVSSDALVTGLVLDPNGKPSSNADVQCKDRKELATVTDDAGRFKLPSEAAGCFVVSRHADFSPSERVELVAGRENVVRLNRGGAIEGEAVDESSRPVSNYLLAIESFVGTGEAAGGTPPGREARTIRDPNGAFRLDNLLPGKYVLTAGAEARPPAKTRVIEVEAGRTTHHVRIVLAQGTTLSGSVIDAQTNRPVAFANVSLDAITSTAANLIPPARTDDSGAYALEGAPAGPFSIRVTHDAYRTKIVTGITVRGPAAVQDVALQPRGDGGAGESELAGIGAVLAPSPEGVVISSVIQGGPAESAGLRIGDVVARIEGADALGLPLSDCMQRLRGPEGSRVLVGVKRDQRIIDMMITRQLIVLR